MNPKFHHSTIYNSQDVETTKMSINRGMDKEDEVQIYNGILVIKEEKIMPFATTQMAKDYHTT